MIPFPGVTLGKCSPYNGNREEISSPISLESQWKRKTADKRLNPKIFFSPKPDH